MDTLKYKNKMLSALREGSKCSTMQRAPVDGANLSP